MNIMIIEDESSNVDRLSRLLKNIDGDIRILAATESVKDSVNFLENTSTKPDLIFADIYLADGLCFSIFDKIKTDIPIIFVTAFDQYALKAFEYNGLAYILKPVTEKDLRKTLDKVCSMKSFFGISNITGLFENVINERHPSLQRLLIRSENGCIPAEMSRICIIECGIRDTKIILDDGRAGISEHTLRYFEDNVNPDRFIRVSRQAIIAPDKVSEFRQCPDGKYEAFFSAPVNRSVVISPEKFQRIRKLFTAADL